MRRTDSTIEMLNCKGIINTFTPKDRYYIYSLTSKTDKNIYIGVTSDYMLRWKQHAHTANCVSRNRSSNPELYEWIADIIKNKKENIYFSILAKGLTEEIAYKREVVYVKKYKELNYNVLNKTNGGLGQRGVNFGKSTRFKMSEHTRTRNGSVSLSNKPVYVRDIVNNITLTFFSAKECASTLNVSYSTVTSRCNKNNIRLFDGKYIFSYSIL